MEKDKICQKLLEVKNEKGISIRKEVAKEALSYSSANPIRFFSDLFQHGCISEMVSCLIYYRDTHAFFLKYYDQIEELRYEIEESQGQALMPKGDLMNWYAWFAFEETARLLAEELEIIKIVMV